jgi:prephenate dehydrogenase
MARIAIIGLGLIGGSLALAIKRAGIKDLEVSGTARSRATLTKARKLGAIDVDAHDPAEAVAGASLVIVAAPIMTFPEIFREMAPALEPGAVVTDVASTKGDVARWAKELLPESVDFVGGHPMAGKESQGIDSADADLFSDRPWVVSPSVSASEKAVNTVVGLAQLAGAKPLFMDADEHDSYVAAISHLPLVLSSALFSVAFGSTAWPELARLASSGFRDTTRLASGSPEMARDIVTTNRASVLHWIDRFEEELNRLRGVIASADATSVKATFERAQLERDNYVINGAPQREEFAPLEKVSFADILLGSKLAGVMRKQQDELRKMEERVERRLR